MDDKVKKHFRSRWKRTLSMKSYQVYQQNNNRFCVRISNCEIKTDSHSVKRTA